MRFKIRTKLLFAFLAMLIPIVALTGLAFYNQKLLYKGITNIKAAASESGHFSDLHFKIHIALMPPHDYLLTGNKKEKDVFKSDMGEIEMLFNKIYEAGFCYQCHALPKKWLDENLNGIKAGIEKIRLKGEEIFKIEHPVGSRDGSRLMAEMDAIAAGVITKQMSSYNEIHGKMLSKVIEGSDRILNKYVVIMVVGHVVLIGLSFLLAYLSSSYIAGPLEKLYKGAESIADGSFDYKVDIRTGDEIEYLAKEFNVMSERLKGFYEELEDKVRERTGELQYEKDKVTKIFNSIEDGICIVNQQYDLEYINPSLEREFGPWKGRKCYEYFHDKTEVCEWCPNRKILAGETSRWESYNVKNKKTYDLIGTPLKNPDGSIVKLGMFRDITGRKKVEEELRQRLDELERFQKATVEREFRIRELRDRVKELEAEIQNLKFKIQGLEKKDN